jgi:CDP-diacylglycerol--serine O-phosphatidyltransferase
MRRRRAELRHPRWSELHERRRQTIFLLPGLLTTGNLLCGFSAIVLTLDQRYQAAALALFVGMIMDILDGKVARLTRTTTQFGVEFDSLADVVSFGVSPAILLYAWALDGLWALGAGAGRMGAGAAFVYVLCAALRLARFNVLTGSSDRRYFIGLPSPGAAGTVAAGVLFLDPGPGGSHLGRPELFVVACATYLLAFFMISSFRYYSFKELDFARRLPFGVLFVAALAILILFANAETLVFIVFALYALSGPFRWLVMRRREPAPPVVFREAPRGLGPSE